MVWMGICTLSDRERRGSARAQCHVAFWRRNGLRTTQRPVGEGGVGTRWRSLKGKDSILAALSTPGPRPPCPFHGLGWCPHKGR